MHTYTVGRLAKRFGLSRSTLLYYDSIGLLSPATRGEGEYRHYGPDEVHRLERICTLRRAGMPLKDILWVLEGAEDRLSVALERRVSELDEEMADLREQQHLVVGLLKVRSKQTGGACMGSEGAQEVDAEGGDAERTGALNARAGTASDSCFGVHDAATGAAPGAAVGTRTDVSAGVGTDSGCDSGCGTGTGTETGTETGTGREESPSSVQGVSSAFEMRRRGMPCRGISRREMAQARAQGASSRELGRERGNSQLQDQLQGPEQRSSREQDAPLNREAWTAVLRDSGFSEEDMLHWHRTFERTNPDGHARFLAFLGMDEEEVGQIRRWASEK